MRVLGIDFETTGLDPEVHRVIEVGAVLWDTDDGKPLSIISEFCWFDDFPEMEPEAFAAHGITVSTLQKYGLLPHLTFDTLFYEMKDAEAVISHFGSTFDRNFYLKECERTNITTHDLTWIDTATDIKYPKRITTRNLVHLAAEHGFLNPFAHRAVFDVLTMMKIFQCYDPQVALEYARQPFVTLQALVSFDDKDKAKARGYHWNPETKQWLKRMRLPDVTEEKAEAVFKTIEVAGE